MSESIFRKKNTKSRFLHSQLLPCCTAWGPTTELSLVGSTKVNACKSFLFTEKFTYIENKEHGIDFFTKVYDIFLILELLNMSVL